MKARLAVGSPYTRLVALLVVIVAVIYGARFGLHLIDSSSPANRNTAASVSQTVAISTAVQAAENVFSAALTALERRDSSSDATNPNVPLTRGPRASDCKWDTAIRRSDASLADEFVMGALSHRVLMRHVILNPEDRPLCPSEEKHLASIVAEYNKAVGPLLSAFRDLRSAEVAALIDAGALKPWIQAEGSDQEVRNAAAGLERMGLRPSDALDLAAASRHRLRTPPGNYMMRGGRYYLLPDATALPQSAAYYERLKFIVVEHMQMVLGWFAAAGFLDDLTKLSTLYEQVNSRAIE